MIMDKTLKSAIEQLDIAAVQDYLKGNSDLTGVTLSFVVQQWGEADEDMFWGIESLEEDLESLRSLDKRLQSYRCLLKQELGLMKSV